MIVLEIILFGLETEIIIVIIIIIIIGVINFSNICSNNSYNKIKYSQSISQIRVVEINNTYSLCKNIKIMSVFLTIQIITVVYKNSSL